VKRTNCEAPRYAVFSILLLLYLKEFEQVLISCGNCL